MGFNENAFMIAGTAIAMFGVGLYMWDTRKEAITNTYKTYTTGTGVSPSTNTNQTQPIPSNYSTRETFSDYAQSAGSKRRKKKNKKTKKRR